MTKRRFGPFEFDVCTHELSRGGVPVSLARQPARLLAALLERPGEVWLREELTRHLWGPDTHVDFERGLNFCVLQVRTALGDDAARPTYVQTLPRRGYKFIADTDAIPVRADRVADCPSPPGGVTCLEDLVPRGLTERKGPRLSGWRGWVAAGVLVAAVVGLLAGLARSERRGSAERRLAVLPVLNLTGDAGFDPVASGLTAALTAQMGRVGSGRFDVVARTSAIAAGEAGTAAAIGKAINATHLLEGVLRGDRERWRLEAALVEAASQTQVWSATLEHDPAAGAGWEDAVAIQAAQAIGAEVLTGTTPVRPPAVSPAAWAAYLNGLAQMTSGRTADVHEAQRQFETALAADPAFAPAWAELALSRHQLVMMGGTRPLASYPKAIAAAERALALDPGLASAHVALGAGELWFRWSPERAIPHFERALGLDASNAVAHHDYAWALAAAGRAADAVRHIERARGLDPLSVRANADVGWLHLQLDRPVDAARACEQTLALDPDALEAQACLERALFRRGLLVHAARAAQRATPQAPAAPSPPDTAAAARARLETIWRWRAGRLDALAQTDAVVSPYLRAVHRALLGDHEAALDALGQAFDERLGVMVLLHADPVFAPLRGSERFQVLVRQVAQAGR